MTTGAGIAVSGVWIFAGLVGSSENTSSIGLIFAVIVASIASAFFLAI